MAKEFPNLLRVLGEDFSWLGGWENLVYQLCKDIEAELVKLPEEERRLMYAVQIKEKYGALRFYMSSETDEICDLITEAEQKSTSICESCGATPARPRGGGWVITHCDRCATKRMLRETRCSSRLEALVLHKLEFTEEQWDQFQREIDEEGR